MYKKELFIFEKKNSITPELCIDIIDIYNDDPNNKINEIYNIDRNLNYAKIKQYLINELYENLHNYLFVKIKMQISNVININTISFSFFIENKKLSNNLHISEPVTALQSDTQCNTNKSESERFNEIQITKRFSHTNKMKLFMYIWFLNDYDGEIIFWNDYRITPKCGNFLMFPISWCFPYEEIIHSCANKYILYGYVYK